MDPSHVWDADQRRTFRRLLLAPRFHPLHLTMPTSCCPTMLMTGDISQCCKAQPMPTVQPGRRTPMQHVSRHEVPDSQIRQALLLTDSAGTAAVDIR